MERWVLRSGTLLLCWLVLAALPACTSKKIVAPAWIDNPRSHPVYPAERYIVGSGRSVLGLADAEQAARAEIARQIDSAIEATTRREVAIVQQGDRFSVGGISEQKILERARFEHAELIEVPVDGTYVEGGTYFALACLDRLKADQLYAREQNRVEGRLRSMHERSMAALEEGRPRELIRLSRQLRGDYDEWAGLRSMRSAITRGIRGDTAPVDRWASDVHSALAAVSDRTIWIVRVEPEDESVPESSLRSLERVLEDEVTRLGVGVQLADGAACEQPTGDRDLAFGLRASLAVDDRSSNRGQALALQVRIVATECFGDQAEFFAVTLDRDAFVGEHPTDAVRAVEQANARLIDASRGIAREIRGAVSSTMP